MSSLVHTYRLFGGRLCADLPLPHLEGVEAAAPEGAGPSWTLRSRHDAPPPAVVEPLGHDTVDVGVAVRLGRTAEGYRLDYDDSGTFTVTGGEAIRWWPGPRSTPEILSADLTGRVLPLALHATGRLSLHGSATALGDEAVVLLAPKHHGKSTLLLALARAGGRVLADDVVPVERAGAGLRVWPGVASVRLLDDSARTLGVSDAAGASVGPGGKLVLHRLPPGITACGHPVACGAFYLIAPAAPDAPVRRERLTGAAAVLALAGHTRLGALLCGEERARLLERVAELARCAPVYVLHVPRALARLPEVTTRLAAWHPLAGAPVGGTPGASSDAVAGA